MQFAIDRQEFLSTLKRAGAAINPSDMLAFRQSVLIVTEAKQPLVITGSSGPLAVICQAHGEVRKPGRALLNHRRLSAIVTELPLGSIEITVNDRFQVSFRGSSGKRKFTMTGADPADFPEISGATAGEALYSIETKILQQACDEVRFGVDKAYTDGILLSPDPDGLKFRCVSMSSRQMAVATGWFTAASQRQECLLPTNLLDAVGALSSDTTELVISMDEQKIGVATKNGETLILALRLATTFPAVWKLMLEHIPQVKRFKVSSDRFLESVRAVSVAADFVEGAERFVQIDIAYEKTAGCVVSTRKSERNFGEDDLPLIEAPEDGSAFRLHIDGGLLSQALRSFSPAELDLYYDAINGQQTLCLRNETLCIILVPITPVGEIHVKPRK